MSDESHTHKTDMKKLETQIENLRCAVITLIILLTLLSTYIVIQMIQLYSIYFFASLGIFIVAILFILLLCAYSYATDKGVDKVAPPPGFEPGSDIRGIRA